MVKCGKFLPMEEEIRPELMLLNLHLKWKNCGAGELLVTSMDKDGTQSGYDIELMKKISTNVNIPVIASGGVGKLDHLVEGIKSGASAVLAASIFSLWNLFSKTS